MSCVVCDTPILVDGKPSDRDLAHPSQVECIKSLSIEVQWLKRMLNELVEAIENPEPRRTHKIKIDFTKLIEKVKREL